MLNERIEKAGKQPTEAELQAIAKAMYEEKLSQLCTAQRSTPLLADEHRFANQGYADYFQRLANNGGGLSMLPAEVSRLRATGWDSDRIESLITAVLLREEGDTGIRRDDIDRHLVDAGFSPDDRLRWVLELALYRPYRDAFLAANVQLHQEMAAPSNDDAVVSPNAVDVTPSVSVKPAATGIPAEWATATPMQAAEMYIQATPRLRGHRTVGKRGASVVDEHTLRQIRCAARLLQQSMPSGTPFWQVTNADILLLDDHFDRLYINFGKAERDRAPEHSLDDAVARAAERVAEGDLPPDDIGLKVGTTNKHFNKLAQIHAFMRKSVPAAAAIEFATFQRVVDQDEREARIRYSDEQGRAIFTLPPWTGCCLKDRLAAGSAIVHDALFYILLLVWYTGARREELCKLMVDDVQEKYGIWHLLVRPTETGRIKNRASQRLIPLHDELIRLGFLRYVEALRDAGERVLFPEIVPGGDTKRKFGDVFYKLWWIYIARHVPGLKRGQAMHSARHMVSDELKDKEVFLEFRNDFLGHKGKGGEGETRYPSAASLVNLKDVVQRIPIVTGHLPDQDAINLLPSAQRVCRPTRGGNVAA